MNPPPQPSASSPASPVTTNKPPTTKSPSINTTSRRGIQGEKWTPAEEHRLRALWNEFQGRSASRYAVEIWLPISERMPGRKPDACHQKAYRMGLLSEKGGREGAAGKGGAGGKRREPRKSGGGVGVGIGVVGGAREQGDGGSGKVREHRELVSGVVVVEEGGRADERIGRREVVDAEETRREPLFVDGPDERDELVEREVVGWVATRPEDAWKHDRNNASGRAWRRERHEARRKWEGGLHSKNLERFCPATCETCEQERRYGR